jgi:hypothetical protein
MSGLGMLVLFSEKKMDLTFEFACTVIASCYDLQKLFASCRFAAFYEALNIFVSKSQQLNVCEINTRIMKTI